MTTIFKHPNELLAAEGKELGVSDWIEIDQARINLFADATGDHQWIHVDPEKAKSGPFGKVRFPAAVKVNSRVRGRGELIKAEEVKGGIQATTRVTVEVEGSDKPACIVDTISRYYPA
jgi:acyl dehydratase